MPDAGDESIFATSEYEAASPPVREFHSWHRPRKQFVRRKQWLHQMKVILDSRSADLPLRYLGLPGPDLLDLRLFYDELCGARRLMFLGFNAAAAGHGPDQIELNISLDEIRGLENLHPSSHIIPDDFRTLARSDSMGWKSAIDTGPFDVVNLDLCDNFLSDEITDASIFQAIAKLFSLQRKAMLPWLLLLTTRVDRATVHGEVGDLLGDVLADNLAACASFDEAYRALTAVTEASVTAPNLVTCSDDQWLGVVGVALAKWLLKLATAADMKYELKSCMSYRVNVGEGPDDLLSIAVQLTPFIAPISDPAGLAATAQSTPLDECDQAKKIPPRVGKVVQVDAVLAADSDLAAAMTEETAVLLEKARYTRADYFAWATA